MSLVATGHIFTKHGIIAIQGTPDALMSVGKQLADDVVAATSQTGPEALSAMELAQLANSSITAANASDPTLASIKVIGSTAAGTAAGLAATPLLTPAGGFLVGFFVGALYDWVFDRSVELDPDPFTGGPWTPLLLSPEEVPTEVNTHWQAATAFQTRDPLAIDLDGDGIETIGIDTHVVTFDHDGDGTRTGTGWLAGDDGWLVMDRNGNGTIDSGVELFGVDTPLGGQQAAGAPTATDGFHALRSLDANQDGVFNAQDPAYWQVQVWQDANLDGVSDAGELQSLSARGIFEIALTPEGSASDLGNGNTLAGTARVLRVDGTIATAGTVELAAGNLNLADNPFYRQFTDTVTPTEAAAALPDMAGSGWTRDLREAMSLGSPSSDALAAAVGAMAASPTRGEQLALADAVLQQWAESTGRMTEAADRRGMTATTVGEAAGQYTVRYTIAEPGQPASARADFDFPSDAYEVTLPGFGGHTVSTLTPAGKELVRRIAILEVFNGSRFMETTRVQNTPPAAPIFMGEAGAPPFGSAGNEAGTPPFGSAGNEAGTPPFGSAGNEAGTPPFGSAGNEAGTPPFGSAGNEAGTPPFGSAGNEAGTPPFGSAGNEAGTPPFGSAGNEAGTPPFGSAGNEAGTPPFGSAGNEAGTPPFGSAGNEAGTPPFGSAGNEAGTPPFGSAGNEAGTPPFGSAGNEAGVPPFGGAWADPLPTIGVPLSEEQIAFVNSAYEHLRDSVHAAVAVQTRLKAYTDQIGLVVDGETATLDFSAMESAVHTRAQSDPYNAVSDLLDLRRFEGPTLAPLGWNADAALATLLGTIAITPEIQSLLDADAAAGAPPGAHAAGTAPWADSIDPAEAAHAEGPIDVAANPKFDGVVPEVQVFPDPPPDAATAPVSPETIADLLIHAAAGMAPSGTSGFSVPPDDRLTHQPEFAGGA